MSRKKKAEVREVFPDPVHNSVLVTKFINGLMVGGKKSIAEQIFYQALDQIHEKTKQEALDIFQSAINNVQPALEVRSRRVGGATYQVPVEVRAMSPDFGYPVAGFFCTLAMNGDGCPSATEFIDAANTRGMRRKKKIDTHRMAEANKAFAHYRWQLVEPEHSKSENVNCSRAYCTMNVILVL